jgi:hypothetical protein
VRASGCLGVAALLVLPALARAQEGSYTFVFDRATAPAGTKVTITATNTSGTKLNKEITIGGLSQSQAADFVNTAITSPPAGEAKATTSMNGNNSIRITAFNDRKIEKVDAKSSEKGFQVVLDASGGVETAQLAAGFRLSVEPDPLLFQPGTLRLAIPTVGTFTTFVGAGTTSAGAAQSLFAVLAGAGFPDVSLDVANAEVEFFLSPAGQPITTIDQFGFDGAGAELGIVLPTAVPEPSSLACCGLGLVLIGGAARRRRAPTRRRLLSRAGSPVRCGEE